MSEEILSRIVENFIDAKRATKGFDFTALLPGAKRVWTIPTRCGAFPINQHPSLCIDARVERVGAHACSAPLRFDG
jgi:hypothetical protein